MQLGIFVKHDLVQPWQVNDPLSLIPKTDSFSCADHEADADARGVGHAERPEHRDGSAGERRSGRAPGDVDDVLEDEGAL